MNKTKKIVISAVLTALSFVVLLVTPSIDLGVWSFTPFSHSFIFLGTLISPFTGIFTYLGVVGCFFLKSANPMTWMRAGSHLFFVVFLILMMHFFPAKNAKRFVFYGLAAALIHAVFEILAVLLCFAVGLGASSQFTFYYILGVVGGGTLIHSCIDYAMAWLLFSAAGVARALPEDNKNTFRFFRRKRKPELALATAGTDHVEVSLTPEQDQNKKIQ